MLSDLPNGAVVKYRKKLYFISKGLDGRILTDTEGFWRFLEKTNWKTYQVVFNPNKGRNWSFA